MWYWARNETPVIKDILETCNSINDISEKYIMTSTLGILVKTHGDGTLDWLRTHLKAIQDSSTKLTGPLQEIVSMHNSKLRAMEPKKKKAAKAKGAKKQKLG